MNRDEELMDSLDYMTNEHDNIWCDLSTTTYHNENQEGFTRLLEENV